MKIAIITVYNSENCGSFMQAYALKTTLEKLGHEVFFLYRNFKWSFIEHIKVGIIKCAKLDFGSALNLWKKYFNYISVNKNQAVVYRNTELFNHIDCFVIGSDTLWDFNSKYFYKNKNTYTGLNLPKVKRVTYAVSAANTGFEVFENDADIIQGIKELNVISVRDASTQSIVQKITGTAPPLVCDPTLLLKEEDYHLFMEKAPVKTDKKYILLYFFSDMSDLQKKHILELKKETGCKIISFGEYRSWCDDNLSYAPNSFLSYMKNADFIITNTFHGTIFSVLFHKKFVDYGGKKLKISNFLNQLGLQDTIIDDTVSLIEKYKEDLDYQNADAVIDVLRQQSLNYLNEALGEA